MMVTTALHHNAALLVKEGEGWALLSGCCVSGGMGWRGGRVGRPAWGSCIPSRARGLKSRVSCCFWGVESVLLFFCWSCFCILAVRMPIFFTLS